MTAISKQKLPPGWQAASLSSIAVITMGQSPPSSTYNSIREGLPFFQGKAQFGDLYAEPTVWCSQPSKIVDANDILLCVRAPVGPTNLAPAKSCIGRGIAGIQPERGINLRYVLHAFRRFSDDLDGKGTGTTFKAVSGKVVREFELPIAPPEEQQRIADALDETLSDLDAGVKTLNQVRKKLNLYRASILKAAVEGMLTAEWRAQHPNTEPASELLKRILAERRRRWEEEQLSKFKEQGKEPPENWKSRYKEPLQPDPLSLPRVPTTWCCASIQQVGDVRLGRQRAPQHHKGDHMRPYLRVANVFDDRLDLSDVKQMNFTPSEFATYALRFGDILLNEGQSPEFVGRPAMYRDEIPGCCYQKTLLRFRSSQGVLPSFALLVFRAYLHSGRFRKSANITTNIAHLVAARFSPMEFPLPPLEEQAVIIDSVENALSVISHLEQDLDNKIRLSHSLRQSILRHAFEGKLVPQDPNDEPALELLKRIAVEREERARKAAATKAASTKSKKSRERSVRGAMTSSRGARAT